VRILPYRPYPRPITDEVIIAATKINAKGCWIWLGRAGGEKVQKYGVYLDKKAHRVVYEHFFGTIEKGLVCDHLCRNTLCVNPGHIEPTSERENILRGIGTGARNLAKTHCPSGHPYNGDNLRLTGANYRQCKACQKNRKILFRERNNFLKRQWLKRRKLAAKENINV
jgi:hypothetical protein